MDWRFACGLVFGFAILTAMIDLIPLFLFVVVMVGTPGPANMVVMTAGASFGFARAIPFILGITMGKLMLNLGMGFGAFGLLQAYPLSLTILKYGSALYVLYLSYTMAKQPLMAQDEALVNVPGFWAGLVVHPLNPKAWAMLTIAWTDYGNQINDPLIRVMIISGIFFSVQIVAHSTWCFAGDRLMKIVTGERLKTYIQQGLAALTAIVVLIVIF